MNGKQSNFDDILRRIGFGRWTVFVYTVYFAWSAVIPLMSFAPAFMNPPLEYTCQTGVDEDGNQMRINEYEIKGIIYEQELDNDNAQITTDDCYNNLGNSNVIEGNNQNECVKTICRNSTRTTLKCERWIYDNSTFYSTVTTEWDLVCDKAYLGPLFGSSYFFGVAVGEPLIGYFADSFGRRKMIRLGALVWVLTAFASSQITIYEILLFFRFILGLIHVIGTGVAYVYAIESCPPDHRVLGGLILTTAHAFTGMLYGGLAYLFRDWRILHMICVIPSIFLLFMVKLMDESPRWLLRKGRSKEAVKILQTAGRWQNVTLPPANELLLSTYEEHNPSLTEYLKEAFNDLALVCSRPLLRRTCVVMFLCWFMVGLSFWGITLSGGNYSSDPFLYMFLTSLMEVPGYSGFIPFVSRFGRVKMLCFNFITAASCFFITLATGSGTWTTLTLALIGKLFIAGSYNILYLSATELFPTNMRSRGLNMSSMMARIASIVAPYIQLYLVSANWWISSVMFGCSCGVGGIVALLLPESNHKPLPETLDHFDQIYDKRKDKEIDSRDEMMNLN